MNLELFSLLLRELPSELVGQLVQELSRVLLDKGGFLVQAAGNAGPSGNDPGGGVGNIVAAALQTKGLIDQAEILTTFRPVLEWIAALGWLFSIAMAIGAVAVFGNYRQGLYLLIGPALFFYMISDKMPTDGTRVLVGDRRLGGDIEDQNNLLRWIRAIGGQVQAGADGRPVVSGGGTVEVSRFFGIFDAVITEATQKVVSVLLDTSNRDDLRFVARERARSFVLQGLPVQGPIAQLIIGEHLGRCAEAITAFQKASSRRENTPLPLRPQSDIDNSEARVLNSSWTRRHHVIDRDVREFLIAMSRQTGPLINPAFFTAGIVGNLIGGNPFGALGLSAAESANRFPQVPWQTPDDQNPVSCEDIWSYVRATTFWLANNRMDRDTFLASFGDEDSEIPWDKVYEDVQQWLGGAGSGVANSPVSSLAAYIYRNAVTNATHPLLQTQIFSRSPFNAREAEGVFVGLAQAEAHGGYFKLQYFATAVPYVQGLILYFLSVAFPFYAVLLVLPGQATSFFAWCALWVWVKSWDVGFALVCVARDIFWHTFNNQVNLYQTRIDWTTPAGVFEVAFANDPLANENTQWILISALTISVPVLTAHMCLGATKLFEMFRYHIDQTTTRFGQVETNVAMRNRANRVEALMPQHMHGMAAVVAANHADRAPASTNPHGAQTALGYPINRMDGRDPAKMNTSPSSGSTNARPGFVGEAYIFARMLLANSSSESRAAIGASSDASLALEAFNRTVNAWTGGLTSGLLPERIPNIYRGFHRMGDELGSDGMQRYQQALESHAERVGQQFGQNSFQYRELQQEISELSQMRARGETLNWDQFYERENNRFSQMQDDLGMYSRRRMAAASVGEGRGNMAQLLEMRTHSARYARNPFDGLSALTIPGVQQNLLPALFGAQGSQPWNPPMNYNGDLFSHGQRPNAPPRATGGSSGVNDSASGGGD